MTNNKCVGAAAMAAAVVLWAAPPALAALTLDTGVNPVLARPGELIDIEITISNTDAVDRTGVTVSIVYPAGLVSIAPANFGGSCPPSFCDPGETITWALGTVRAGRSVTVDLPTAVAAATADGTLIDFDFTVTDDTLQSDTASSVVQVETQTLYDVALRDSADPVAPGAQLTYRVAFALREEAPLPADSIVRFALPAGTTFVFASDGGVQVGGDVQWPVGTVQPGEGGVRTVVLSVTAPEGAVLAASAEIASVADPGQNALAQALTVVDTGAPLGLHIDANADPARPAEQLNVQLLVINNDTSARNNLTLRLRYPDGLSATSNGNIHGGSCPPIFCDPHETLTIPIATIPARSTLLFDLAPVVAAAAPDGTFVHFFAMLNDTAGGNASAIDSVRVRTGSLHDLAVRDSADPAQSGERLDYKLSFGYREEAAQPSSALLRFVIPTGTTFASASDGGALIGNAVEWNLGALAAGSGGARHVAVTVNAGAPAALRAVAGLFDSTRPYENFSAEALTAIQSAPPLAVQVSANANPSRPNAMLNVQYVVTNRDIVPRTVTLRARYPDDVGAIANSNIVWVPAGACPPSFCTSGEMVTWALGEMQPGHSVTVEINPPVAAAASDAALIHFHAIAGDASGAQASSTDTVRVDGAARYELLIRDSADAVVPGSLLTYALTFGYRADAPSTANTALRFRVPEGSAFVSASAGGTVLADVVQWDIGGLAPGDGGKRSVTVLVGAPDASVLQARADIYNTGNPLANAAAGALTVVDDLPALSLNVAFESNPALPNELVTTRYTVTNLDANPRTVTLKARFPDGLFSTSPSVNLSPPGSCPPSFCDPFEMVTWSLGIVGPGDSAETTMITRIHTSAVLGQLIEYFAIVTDTDGGIATSVDAARLGACSDDDADCDGIADAADNCTLHDNPAQTDTDGDGFGNRCDADLNNDGIVNPVDLGLFRAQFFAVGPNAADFNDDGIVNPIDLGILRQLFFRPPGPAGALTARRSGR